MLIVNRNDTVQLKTTMPYSPHGTNYTAARVSPNLNAGQQNFTMASMSLLYVLKRKHRRNSHYYVTFPAVSYHKGTIENRKLDSFAKESQRLYSHFNKKSTLRHVRTLLCPYQNTRCYSRNVEDPPLRWFARCAEPGHRLGLYFQQNQKTGTAENFGTDKRYCYVSSGPDVVSYDDKRERLA